LLLAFETATRSASIALLAEGECLVEEQLPRDRGAAEVLLPAVDAVLNRAGVRLDAVEAFAVSIGPGSFSGLRVGLATVKGLAFGTPRPVVAVPTLAALARRVPDARDPVLALLDARRGELYAAAYDPGDWEPLGGLAEGVYTPEQLCERIRPPCVLVGEIGVAEQVRERLGEGVRLQPDRPSARCVAELGAELLARGEGVDAARLVPNYVRRADAEVKQTGLRFEGR